MFKGKKDSKDLAMETAQMLFKKSEEVSMLLLKNNDYEERKNIERLIDAIERSKEDIRRNCLRKM